MELKRWLHELFEVSIIIKGIDGALEFVSGMILLFNSSAVSHLVNNALSNELLEDPKDISANFFMNALHQISPGIGVFIVTYLLVNGLLKILIVTFLLLKKSWAYPLSGVLLSLFSLYSIYRLILNFSYVMLVLTAIDIIIIALLRLEYQEIKKKQRIDK